MTCAIEDAGFEIRDSLHWIYGSGFPKSLDISKAIDKTLGAEREVISRPKTAVGVFAHSGTGVPQDIDKYADSYAVTAPATDEAKQWDGWGTALKPSHEPIVLARKPFPRTVASNVLEHGTGGINVGETRTQDGRWPPNILYTHSRDCDDTCVPGCPVLELNTQSGIVKGFSSQTDRGGAEASEGWGNYGTISSGYREGYNDTGGASRFFPCFRYNAKAPGKERPRGDETHSTVKPLELMRWLVRLITPPEGTVLDHFAGSGTTGEACSKEGMGYVLIEKEAQYIPLIHSRLSQPSLFEEL
jgi:site-specific DNA-methyltransferase (adenine-specific)